LTSSSSLSLTLTAATAAKLGNLFRTLLPRVVCISHGEVPLLTTNHTQCKGRKYINDIHHDSSASMFARRL
jgi:hypothetical protein